jgi:hypothetical protein
MPSSFGVTRWWSVKASRLPLDVDQRQAGLDAQHHQRLFAEGPDAVVLPGFEHSVEYVERLVGLDRDLEPEVAGVAGARQCHRRRFHFCLCVLEVREGVRLGHQRGQHAP